MAKSQKFRISCVPIAEQPDHSCRRVDIWFEVPLGGTWETAPWRASYRLKPQGDEILVSELRVFPHLGSPGCGGGEWNVEEGVVPDGGITARLIRDEIVIGKHIHQWLPEHWDSMTGKKLEGRGHGLAARQISQLFEAMLGRLGFTDKPVRHVPRRGPKGRSDLELAKIAKIYVDACERDERAPVKIVAEELGIKPASARDAIHKARKVEVLTRTVGGRPGGQVTEYGNSLLRGQPTKKQP